MKGNKMLSHFVVDYFSEYNVIISDRTISFRFDFWDL